LPQRDQQILAAQVSFVGSDLFHVEPVLSSSGD
jgi:hypothetical protein